MAYLLCDHICRHETISIMEGITRIIKDNQDNVLIELGFINDYEIIINKHRKHIINLSLAAIKVEKLPTNLTR